MVNNIAALVLSWPFLLFVIGTSIVCTIACNWIKFVYFIYSWKISLFPEKVLAEQAKTGMTPFQALINTLSANLGNGSIAGMATAVYSGGPGAAFLVVLFGLFVMAVRFAEVFLSTHFGSLQEGEKAKTGLGGPMLYLQKVPGGQVLSYIWAFACLLFGLIIGNAMQANSIRISLATTWNIHPQVTAGLLLIFIMYVVWGGASRVIKLSEKIVPLKVALFFISTFIVLIYHWQALWPALMLIFKSAFNPVAPIGGILGFSVQQAVRYGMARSVMATESGLGTAAVFFGFTGSKTAVKDGIMATLSTFLSTIVCFLIALSIVASGVWNSGQTSTALTIAAFGTVFGNFGGWVVSFLSISFGIGVAVAFAYVCNEVWLFLTGGRLGFVFPVIYCLFTVMGALSSVDLVFQTGDIVVAPMLLINLFGILWLLPLIKKHVHEFMKQQ